MVLFELRKRQDKQFKTLYERINVQVYKRTVTKELPYQISEYIVDYYGNKHSIGVK